MTDGLTGGLSVGLASRLIRAAPAWSPDATATNAARASDRCRRSEHKFPQLIVILIFIDLDAGTFVRAGDTCDRTHLIARRWRGLYGGRLARIGQNLVDEIQSRIGILRAARLPGWLSRYAPRIYGSRISLLRLSLRDRHHLTVGINPESWWNARLDPSRQPPRAGLSRKGKLSRNLAWYLSWYLTWDLSRNLSWCLAWNQRRTKLSGYLSGELRVDAALCSRLCSRSSQGDGGQTSRLIRAGHGRQCNRRKPAWLSRLARSSQCDRRQRRIPRLVYTEVSGHRLSVGVLGGRTETLLVKTRRRIRAIAGALQYGRVHLGLAIGRSRCVAGGLSGTIRCSRSFLHQGIRQVHSVAVNDAPLVFAGVRIDVAAAQKSFLALLQVFDAGRKLPVVGDVIELNGADVLLAAVDQELLFFALGFEGYAR